MLAFRSVMSKDELQGRPDGDRFLLGRDVRHHREGCSGYVPGKLVQGPVELPVTAGRDDRAVGTLSRRPPGAGLVEPVGAR